MLFAVVVALFPTLQALAGTWDAQWKQVDEAVTEALRGGFTLRVTMVRENQAYLTCAPGENPPDQQEVVDPVGAFHLRFLTNAGSRRSTGGTPPAWSTRARTRREWPRSSAWMPPSSTAIRRAFPWWFDDARYHRKLGHYRATSTSRTATVNGIPWAVRTPGTRELPHGCCGSLHPRSVPVRHNQEWLGTQPRLFPIRRAAASRSIASFNPLRVPHKSGRLDRTQSSSVACREQRTASSAPSRLFRPSHPPLELNPTAAG